MARYTDIPAVMQVIGSIYQNPSLLDNEKYNFTEEDFTEDFHRIVFGSIYNLHQLGAEEININTITDYLETRPNKLATFKVNNGVEYLQKLGENTQLAAFDYYYNRVHNGIDVRQPHISIKHILLLLPIIHVQKRNHNHSKDRINLFHLRTQLLTVYFVNQNILYPY